MRVNPVFIIDTMARVFDTEFARRSAFNV